MVDRLFQLALFSKNDPDVVVRTGVAGRKPEGSAVLGDRLFEFDEKKGTYDEEKGTYLISLHSIDDQLGYLGIRSNDQASSRFPKRGRKWRRS